MKRLEEAARLLPRRLDAFFHRARGLQSLGRLDEAGHELDTVLAIDATFIPARMLKRVIAGAAPGGGPPGGEPAGLAPGAPEWAADWVAAQEALSAKRWDEAAGAYEKLIEMSRRGGEPYLGAAIEFRLGRGHALLEKGDLNGAVLEFGAASDRWPEALEPALLLGKAWHLKGERAQAESTFERIFARVTSGEKSDELAVWISNVHGRLKDFEKALLWAEKLSPGALRERLRASCLHRLDRLEESALKSEVSMPWVKSFETQLGRTFSTPTLGETIVQVASHSTYHRGQVNARLREVGGEPPLVDYIAWIWFGRPEPNWSIPGAAAV